MWISAPLPAFFALSNRMANLTKHAPQRPVLPHGAAAQGLGRAEPWGAAPGQSGSDGVITGRCCWHQAGPIRVGLGGGGDPVEDHFFRGAADELTARSLTGPPGSSSGADPLPVAGAARRLPLTSIRGADFQSSTPASSTRSRVTRLSSGFPGRPTTRWVQTELAEPGPLHGVGVGGKTVAPVHPFQGGVVGALQAQFQPDFLAGLAVAGQKVQYRGRDAVGRVPTHSPHHVHGGQGSREPAQLLHLGVGVGEDWK